MVISFSNNTKSIQPKQTQDVTTDPVRNADTEESTKFVRKNKVASTEISSSHNGSFDDKRLSSAKSAILYEVSVKDTDHINELKEAVKNGTYHVPTELLAEEILK